VVLKSSFSIPGAITSGIGTATIGTLNRDNYNVVLQALTHSASLGPCPTRTWR
jgi:hypothetical protein